MRVVGIIQARMRSTRLPAKILKVVCGRTVLEHDIIRLRAARRLDTVVVATGEDPANNPVAEEATRLGVPVSRGSEDDVLSRFYHAARSHEADVIVRMTSDCPLFDPQLLDEMLAEFLDSQNSSEPFDYYSNTLLGRTYPTGLDAEIFTMAALERAFHEATRQPEREHVTPYLHQNPQLFRLGGMRAEQDNSHHRWTLDTPEDLQLIEAIYDEVYHEDALFTTEEVLALFARRPELIHINQTVEAKAIDPEVKGGLVIRCDLSPRIGAGHFMRCLALAQAWPADRGPVVFAMAEGGVAVASRLADEGCELRVIHAQVGTEQDSAALREMVAEIGAEWMVVDGYRFDRDYLASLTGKACRLLVLDDAGAGDLPPADAVLNQNLHAHPDLYPALPASTRLLAGLEYQLLRREFLGMKRPEDTRGGPARHLLVTLGGGDPRDAAPRILQGLNALPDGDLRIRILTGHDTQSRQALQAAAQASPHEVEVLGPVQDMPAQLGWADLAITGGGSTLWELAYLGVPALVVVVAKNQIPSSRLLAEKGSIRLLGEAATLRRATVVTQVADLLADTAARQAMSVAGRELVDGQGTRRVVAKMVHWSRRRVS